MRLKRGARYTISAAHVDTLGVCRAQEIQIKRATRVGQHRALLMITLEVLNNVFDCNRARRHRGAGG
jgi:hypothetical protein